MGVAFASVFLYSGSMSTSTIVAPQQDRWYVLLLPVSFIIYIVHDGRARPTAPRSTCRSPRATWSAASTPSTRSIKFALFMLAEYVNMVTVSAVATTLFLGGWRAPWPISTFWEGANHGWWPMLWFVDQGAAAAVLLHLAARHAAPRPLRPADEAGLEGPHPGLDGLADAGRHRAGAAQRELRLPVRSCSTSAAGARAAAAVSLVADIFRDRGREGPGRGSGKPARRSRSTRWRAGSPYRRCPARSCRPYRGAPASERELIVRSVAGYRQ